MQSERDDEGTAPSAHQARLDDLFERALDVPPAERAAFVRDACGEDRTLCAELTSLLDSLDASARYFDDLSERVVAPVIGALVASSEESSASVLPRLQQRLAGTYRIERELGGGGMSRIFVAEDLQLKRHVVIKVLPPEAVPTGGAHRFRREIELAAQLQHPHIVPLLAADPADGIPYYTMPLVAGESLRERLEREGALPVQDALRIWRDVLEALAHAHASGVVHRDVKPGNILLSGRNALVTDLGIASAVESAGGDAGGAAPGPVIGTPAYMAPEQAAGACPMDHRIDVYAAGVVMYEMLAGAPPFGADSTRELLLAHLEHEPPPLLRPDAPGHVVELVGRCLAKKPEDRPQSAEEILAALESGDPAAGVRAGTARRLRRAAALGLAVVAVAAALFSAVRTRPEPLDQARAAAALPTIAVLPLANLGTDPADAALAEGMTQELTTMLGRYAQLRVIASTSVSALPDRRTMGVRQIADALQASHVLEGSWQKAGGRLRIQVRLVDARLGSTLWSETYDEEFAGVFEVPNDIARQVASELAERLAGTGTVPPPARYTPKLAAYESYLRGMDPSLLRTDSGLRAGVEHFNRAIAIDSSFAAAHAGLVRMYVHLSNGAPDSLMRGWLVRARAAAFTALALDDMNADAHAALGWYHLGSKEVGPAGAAFRRALALDPGVPRGHEGLARVFMMTGRPNAQLAEARLGLARDPASHSAIREHALALATNGRCEESLEQLQAMKSLSPPASVAGVVAGLCYASRAMWAEAVAEFRWAESRGARAAPALLAHALARAGRREEAARILSELLTGGRHSHGSFGIAVVYAGLGDYDQAFAWLDRAVDDDSINIYIMHPLFADLHRDVRFQRLKRRLGVAAS